MLNGCEIVAAIDEQDRLMLDLAGAVTREQLTAWLEKHVQAVS